MSTDDHPEWPIDRATIEALGRSREAILIADGGWAAVRLARAIHDAGPRRLQPFLHLSCAGLPADVLRSELFGHEKNEEAGFFREKQGLADVARGGTLCLFSVETAPRDVLTKLSQLAAAGHVHGGVASSGPPGDVRLIVIVASAKDGWLAAGQGLSEEFLRSFTRIPAASS